MASKERIDKLTSDGAVFRCQGLMECLKTNETSEEVVNLIQGLTTDSVIMLGRPVSALATAVLDRLGITPYTGTDQAIIAFINTTIP